ncbi:transcriptional regulator, IclR family protein [Acetobacteraceae bacterium AT-5844]|nr:transcriptional regulator, IclR family protein [Acetobacteraceae bacterium AT-5844]
MLFMPQLSSNPGLVRSALRALDLLVLLNRTGPMTHAALAKAMEMPKSSLTLLLRTLAEEGYLVADGRAWRTGPALSNLAAPKPGLDLAALARPVVRRLSDEAEESAGFVVLEGTVGRVLASAVARHPLTYAYRVGQRLPLHATSWGKVLLAAMPEAELEDYLARTSREHFTPHTITDAASLRAEIERTGPDGLGRSREERHLGIIGLARLARDGSGAAVGAFNVALPSVRFSDVAEARIVAALDRATASLAAQLVGRA